MCWRSRRCSRRWQAYGPYLLWMHRVPVRYTVAWPLQMLSDSNIDVHLGRLASRARARSGSSVAPWDMWQVCWDAVRGWMARPRSSGSPLGPPSVSRCCLLVARG
jgi:hypothetical protein